MLSDEISIVDGWLRPASHCPSPNQNERPQQEVSLLVIHNISLPPGQFGGGYIEDLFLNSLPTQADPYFEEIAELQVSAHLLIDREGEVTQFVGFDKRAWHAGVSCYEGRDACNDFSIGIELEGTDDQPFTAAQYTKLVEICVVLFRCYPGLKPDRIVGHSDIAPGRKTDPGPCFDWQKFRNMLPSSHLDANN